MAGLNLSMGLGLSPWRYGEAPPLTPPDPADIVLTLGTLPGDPAQSLSISVTAGPGTVYWMIDANATRTAEQIIAGGGAASGSQAYTDLDINLGAIATSVSPGEYYIHAVAVVGSETSNVVSDELTLQAVQVDPVGSFAWTTGAQDIPGDYAVGDMMFAHIANNSGADISAPTGWTAFSQQSNGSLRIRCFYKLIEESETSIASFTGASRHIVSVWRNCTVVRGTTSAQGYNSNNVQVPAYSLNEGDGDVSGAMCWVVTWVRQSTADAQSNGSPTGVTRLTAHNTTHGAVRAWMGFDRTDSRGAFSGSDTGSTTLSWAQIFRLQVS